MKIIYPWLLRDYFGNSVEFYRTEEEALTRCKWFFDVFKFPYIEIFELKHTSEISEEFTSIEMMKIRKKLEKDNK